MASAVAGFSVSASTLLSGNSSIPASWGSSGSSGVLTVRVGRPGRSRIGARLAVERSGFLGESFADGQYSLTEIELGREGRSSRAQCFAGLQGRGGGRVFFMPFGAPGRGGGRGTFARSEWERRQQAQQERFREMVEREIKARTEGEGGKRTRGRDSYEFSLLRELEKRLKFEEKASRKEGGGDDEESDQEGESLETEEAETEGAKAGFGASTYELMKELEKRLRAERESKRRDEQSTREKRGEREGPVFRMGDYSSLYDLMRDWDREMREQRSQLEEQWRGREGRRGQEGREGRREHERRERNPEERVRGQRRRHEEESGTKAGAAADVERREEVGKEVEEESMGSSAAPPSVAPEYDQSNSTVIYLKNEANGAEIYLVGTSHVSQKSVDEVREVIGRVKPDFVMVELCRKRYKDMSRFAGQKDSPMAFVQQMVRMLTNGNVGVVGKLMGMGLSSFYRLLSYRGFHPGREFQAAIEEGKKVGAKIVLGDQDIDTTLTQMGKFNLNMSVQDAFQFFGQRMPDDIASTVGGKYASDEDMFERMRDRNVVRRFNEEMEKGAPSIYKALVSERNEVMVKALRNLKGKVVAVVGLAHMDGMEQIWQQANEKFLSGKSNETVE